MGHRSASPLLERPAGPRAVRRSNPGLHRFSPVPDLVFSVSSARGAWRAIRCALATALALLLAAEAARAQTDTTAPTVQGAEVSGVTLTITFDEALAAAANLANSAFEVKKTPSGGSEQTLGLSGSPSIRDATVTLTLASGVVNTDTDVKVTYTRPTSGSDNRLEDSSGNEVASFTDQAVDIDATPPAFVGAAVIYKKVYVAFDEALDPDSVPAPGDFRVAVQKHHPYTPTEVAITGATVILTMGWADSLIIENVTVRYTRPDSNPLQDASHNAVARFDDQNVVKPPWLVSDAALFVGGGTELALTFDEGLDTSSRPATTAFKVWINGVVRDVVQVSFAANNPHIGTLILTVSPPSVGRGDTIRIRYTLHGYDDLTWVRESPGVNNLRDLDGYNAVPFDAIWGFPPSPPPPPPRDTTPPALVSAAVDGATLSVTFDEALDPGSAPAGDAFTVSGGRTGTGTAMISSATATVRLDSAVAPGETVTVSYTPPGSNPLQDAAGNDVAALSGEAVDNVTRVVTMMVPLLPSASDPHRRQGFMRVVNHSAQAGEVSILAIDDAGMEYGPVQLDIDAHQMLHFNSDDLEQGNERKGLSGGVGPGQGSWRLVLTSGLDLEVLSYVRARDGGALASMHDVVPEDEGVHRVVFFNPASNASRVSGLRLVNPGEEAVAVRIEGTDDAGEEGESAVELTLAPRASRMLSVQVLESGEDEGLAGALGDGAGKWRLRVTANQPIRVMNLLRHLDGAHLTNVSTAPEPEGALHRVPLLPAAAHPHRDGVVRIINRSAQAGEVSIVAFDDTGMEYGPLTLGIGAKEAVHLTSRDLEGSNLDKGLESGTGAGEGAWRLELTSALDLKVLSYVRTRGAGVLASMHDVAPEDEGVHRVVFFNPANNRGRVSGLRLINPGKEAAAVRIEGVDDAGEAGEGAVALMLAPGASRTLSAQALESGEGEGLAGALGDGEGKWRLRVSADHPIRVMSLLRHLDGAHLTNVSTAPGRIRDEARRSGEVILQ